MRILSSLLIKNECGAMLTQDYGSKACEEIEDQVYNKRAILQI